MRAAQGLVLREVDARQCEFKVGGWVVGGWKEDRNRERQEREREPRQRENLFERLLGVRHDSEPMYQM